MIRRLFLADRSFRSVCEDYRIAREGLATFEALSALSPRSEVEEYRNIVRDLEAEIMATVRAFNAAPASGGRRSGAR